jgi:hypothetical protein
MSATTYAISRRHGIAKLFERMTGWWSDPKTWHA